MGKQFFKLSSLLLFLLAGFALGQYPLGGYLPDYFMLTLLVVWASISMVAVAWDSRQNMNKPFVFLAILLLLQMTAIHLYLTPVRFIEWFIHLLSNGEWPMMRWVLYYSHFILPIVTMVWVTWDAGGRFRNWWSSMLLNMRAASARRRLQAPAKLVKGQPLYTWTSEKGTTFQSEEYTPPEQRREWWHSDEAEKRNSAQNK